MVVKEVHTEHAIIRFDDSMFEDDATFQKRIKAIRRIITSAYREKALISEQLEKAPTISEKPQLF